MTTNIGVFMSLNDDDPEVQLRKNAFLSGLAPTPGEVQITYCFGDFGEVTNYAQKADQLVALNPDGKGALVASCWPTVSYLQAALKKAKKTQPVIYAGLFDPTANYKNYGKNVTGTVSHEFDVCAPWPGLLKQISPQLHNVAIVHDEGNAGTKQVKAVEDAIAALGKLGIDLKLTMKISAKIGASLPLDAAIRKFAVPQNPQNGLIVAAGAVTAARRDLIVALADMYDLPAIYPNRMYATMGGLISWGANVRDQYTDAGALVGKLIRPNPPALPSYNTNTTFELVINQPTAAALGLTPIDSNLLKKATTVIT